MTLNVIDDRPADPEVKYRELVGEHLAILGTLVAAQPPNHDLPPPARHPIPPRSISPAEADREVAEACAFALSQLNELALEEGIQKFNLAAAGLRVPESSEVVAATSAYDGVIEQARTLEAQLFRAREGFDRVLQRIAHATYYYQALATVAAPLEAFVQHFDSIPVDTQRLNVRWIDEGLQLFQPGYESIQLLPKVSLALRFAHSPTGRMCLRPESDECATQMAADAERYASLDPGEAHDCTSTTARADVQRYLEAARISRTQLRREIGDFPLLYTLADGTSFSTAPSTLATIFPAFADGLAGIPTSRIRANLQCALDRGVQKEFLGAVVIECPELLGLPQETFILWLDSIEGIKKVCHRLRISLRSDRDEFLGTPNQLANRRMDLQSRLDGLKAALGPLTEVVMKNIFDRAGIIADPTDKPEREKLLHLAKQVLLAGFIEINGEVRRYEPVPFSVIARRHQTHFQPKRSLKDAVVAEALDELVEARLVFRLGDGSRYFYRLGLAIEGTAPHDETLRGLLELHYQMHISDSFGLGVPDHSDEVITTECVTIEQRTTPLQRGIDQLAVIFRERPIKKEWELTKIEVFSPEMVVSGWSNSPNAPTRAPSSASKTLTGRYASFISHHFPKAVDGAHPDWKLHFLSYCRSTGEALARTWTTRQNEVRMSILEIFPTLTNGGLNVTDFAEVLEKSAIPPTGPNDFTLFDVLSAHRGELIEATARLSTQVGNAISRYKNGR